MNLTMKKQILIALTATLCAGAVIGQTPVHISQAADKKCSDCGCNGPDKQKKCPDEAGKQCSCPKK